MIDGLIAGHLVSRPESRTTKAGKPYVTARVRAPVGGDETISVSVITLVDAVREALLMLDAGDAVALSGSLTPRVRLDRTGKTWPALDMVAHAITTLHRMESEHTAPRNGAEAGLHDRSETCADGPNGVPSCSTDGVST